MAESVLDLLVKLGLSDHTAVKTMLWVSDMSLWLISTNVLIAGAIKHLRLKHGDCVASWALLSLMLTSSLALGLVSSISLELFLLWLAYTSFTIFVALSRQRKELACTTR